MSTMIGLIKSAFEYLSLHLLRRIEIRYRLFNSFVLLSLLPLLISGYISYDGSSKAIEKKARIFSTEMVKQVSKNVQLQMEAIDEESEDLVLSEPVQNALSDIADGNELAQSTARLSLTRELLNNYGSADFINQKYLLDKNNKIMDTQVFAQLTRGVMRFVEHAPSLQGRPYWGTYDDGVGQQSIGMLRSIISKNSNKLIGKLFLVIRPEHFSKIFDDIDLGRGTNFFILDTRNGKVIVWPHGKAFSNTDDMVEPALLDQIARSMQHNEPSSFVAYIDNQQKEIKAAYTQIPGTTWFVVSTIPESNLTKEAQIVRNQMVLIGFLCLLFSIVMAYIISYSISAPLKVLVDKMQDTGSHVNLENIEKSTLDVMSNEGHDELTKLAKSFARMHDAIHDKIKIIENQNEQLKKSDQLKKELNQSLEQKVADRTAELELAKKLAESANRNLVGKNALLEHLNAQLQHNENVLRERETLLSETQNIAGLGIYVLDIQTGLWESSYLFDKLFGIDETYDRSLAGWLALTHPDDRTILDDYFRNKVLVQGNPFDMEYRIVRHNDKTERWIHCLGNLEFDTQGHPLKMLGAIQDITAHREYEAELTVTRDLLREVEQRQMLSQERQRLMQDMHDGLGSSLVSALRVVEHGHIDKAEVAHVLRGCIDDLKLAIDSMEPVGADLLLLLATLRFRLSPRLESTGIALRWEVESVPDLDWLDPKNALHILRILQEAFTNIIKHTYATEIRVTTKVEDDYVLVTISDNGQGFSVENALKKGGKGISNQMRRAESIGAKISLNSNNAGTNLTLWLPIKRTPST